jgi:hypothetical protein
MSAREGVARAGAGARRVRRTLNRAMRLALSAVAATFLFPPHTAAQGCAMCYQSAAATGSRSIVALQHGILILLIPSVGLFLGIFGLIFSRRNVSR